MEHFSNRETDDFPVPFEIKVNFKVSPALNNYLTI